MQKNNKNNGSSSSQASPKTRNDQKQKISRNHNNNNNNRNNRNHNHHNGQPSHDLENIYHNDWKLFIWISSLKEFENYIYLFIIIWDVVKPRGDKVELFKEFNDEIVKMKGYIGDLFK